MEYISERIVNIADMENLIWSAYKSVDELRKELSEERPDAARVHALVKSAHLSLLKAADFEFCVEQRRAIRTG